jgi:LmbE family N-acetylglucosaminyl deacetylase
VRIICIGAHPDDCEIEFGGTAAKFAALGHDVKFVSVTNGAAGHHRHSPKKLAAIRQGEAEAAARRLGIVETQILSYPDGDLAPTLEARHDILRQIRNWRADLVLTHRPWDYHPDHRYTAQLVQDSAYLVMVPHLCPDAPALRHNPVFLYLEDRFQLPVPFIADVAVDIDDVWDRKIDALDAHASQVYEWLPWVSDDETNAIQNPARKQGEFSVLPSWDAKRARKQAVDSVLRNPAREQGAFSPARQQADSRELPSSAISPSDPADRRAWLARTWSHPLTDCTRAALTRRYGSNDIQHAEAFQVCEYGRRPSRDELDEIFPR